MAESHIYGLLGLILLLAFTVPYRHGSRTKNRQAIIRDNLASQEYARTQAFLSELMRENERLRLENDALFHQLMSRREQDDGQIQQAMKDLGLDPAMPLTQHHLKRAYVASMKRYHPDQGGSSQDLARIMRAYSLLQQAMAAA